MLRLLVVDDEPMICDVLSDYLQQQGFACSTCSSAESALARLADGGFDLVLSDLNLPGASGLELLDRIRQQFPQVEFLMVTAANDVHSAVDAMRNGAADYLVKPLELKKVLAAVEGALSRKRERTAAEASRRELERLLGERSHQLNEALQQLHLASGETVQAMAIALDVRASEVAGHSLRVSRYSVELARRFGYPPSELARIEHAAWLHDIGKLGIPDAILNKPGALTPEETEIMRGHVRIGYELVRQVPTLAPAAELVMAHQEKYDGSGYPLGLAGDQIPLDARIFALADTLDAMTSDRPYRRALSWSHAREEIVAQAGRQFDPAVVAVFLQVPGWRWLELQAAPANLAVSKPQGGSNTAESSSRG